MSDIAVVLAASLPPTIAAIAALLQSRRNDKHIGHVKQQLATENGLSVGQLADRNEAERIMLNIMPEHRTAAEQAYVESYLAQGRNVGHEGQEPGPVRADPLLLTRPARAPEAGPLKPAPEPANPRPPIDTPPA